MGFKFKKLFKPITNIIKPVLKIAKPVMKITAPVTNIFSRNNKGKSFKSGLQSVVPTDNVSTLQERAVFGGKTRYAPTLIDVLKKR